MTAKNMSRRFALLAAVLSLLVLLSFAVVPGFAADEAASEPATSESVEATPDESSASAESASEPTAETAGETGTAAATGTGTASATEAATGTEASTETGTTAVTPDAGKNQWSKEDTYRLVINLSVGGVIVLAAVALLIVFRKKIPGFVKALKSECGKIVWCPKDKLKKNSIVVLLTIVVIAVLIFLLDLAFSEGLVLLRNLIKKI